MPRFDNEGFNPEKRINNDTRDRSVPADENYYGEQPKYPYSYPDVGTDDAVVDNQSNNSVNINSYVDSFDVKPPERNSRQSQSGFRPEVTRDYDEERRRENKRQVTNRPPRQRRKHSKRDLPPAKKIARGVVAVLLALVLMLLLVFNVALGRINYDEAKDNQYVSSSELKSSIFVKNILLLGVDARPNQETEKSRADSMMLISIDMKHRCIKMTSFLRDTWVYVPAHQGEQRLNSASSYDGYNGVVDTIEYNFGVDVDGYVVADFEMFKVLVDSVGGVEVDVTKKEAKEVNSHPKRYGNVKLEAGKHKLTGEQALAYCRIRKIDTDFVRTKRQRTVMQSIISEVKGGNPFKLLKMAMNSAPYIETNLTKGQLIRTAMAGMTCMKGQMVQQRVPFEHTWDYATKKGASVIAINVEKNKELLIDYIYNKTPEEVLAEQQ
ncbi:MAG: LCP family protein [Eubacterium sp.]|nr:LCP family protein [Eubacterium sp.]